MSLVEDYLRAVGLLLPKDKRDDIVEELRELIHDKTEEREAELGRPLTPDETEDLLRGIGHPLVIAARYRGGPQTIVGPGLYVFWSFAIRMALTVQGCVILVVFLGQAVGSGDIGRALGHAFANAVTGAATTIGFITAAAWVIERQTHKPDFVGRWRVKDLRFLEVAAWDLDDWRGRLDGLARGATPSHGVFGLSARRGSPVSRGLGVIVGAALALMWWTGMIRFGFTADPQAWRLAGVEPGALAGVDWPAFKAQLFWPVVAYSVVVMVWGFVVMARPYALRLQGLLEILMGAAVLAFVAWVAGASPLAPAWAGQSLAEVFERVRSAAEAGPPFPLAAVVGVLLAVTVLNGAFRIIRGVVNLAAPAAAPWARRPA